MSKLTNLVRKRGLCLCLLQSTRISIVDHEIDHTKSDIWSYLKQFSKLLKLFQNLKYDMSLPACWGELPCIQSTKSQ